MTENKKRQSILIVDDEPDLVDLLVFEFEKYDIEILTTYDGESAFKIIKEKSPDFVVTDFNMPKMSGLELIKKIKTLLSKQPKFYLSLGNPTDLSDSEIKKYGISGVFVKPYDTMSVVKAVLATK